MNHIRDILRNDDHEYKRSKIDKYLPLRDIKSCYRNEAEFKIQGPVSSMRMIYNPKTDRVDVLLV